MDEAKKRKREKKRKTLCAKKPLCSLAIDSPAGVKINQADFPNVLCSSQHRLRADGEAVGGEGRGGRAGAAGYRARRHQLVNTDTLNPRTARRGVPELAAPGARGAASVARGGSG